MIEPLVTIIIPVYNGSNYMREAIDSALAQTYSRLEVIVVNDGSNDNGETERIALSYGPRIRYFYKENGGVSSALNKGIQEMRGEYFSWLSHDDVYENNKIEKQVEAINQYSLDRDTLIYCNNISIDANSVHLGAKNNASQFVPFKLYRSKDVLTILLQKATFNGCGLLIPRKALVENGLFCEELRFCQDAFMWYNIYMSNYKLFCIDDTLVKNRVHSGQLTQTGQTLFRKECQKISRILVKRFADISTTESNFLKMYLLSDARFFRFKTVSNIVSVGKKNHLISNITSMKAYVICGYGHIRPVIRRLYYAIFRRMKTS